jgi:ABC-type oligopeptide transport system substrate-binding subunit
VGRLALALALIAAGAAMFAASARTGSGVKDGGTFRYGTAQASVQLDPQLAYVNTAWWLEYATALKLVNWPDRPGPAGTRLVLEGASSFAVSNRGKTYTFVVRKSLRFSDGSPVTARSFAYAIDRTANKQLASPSAPFITDPYGANIVGAKRVNDGYATHVSGVTGKGYRLVIRLTKPDGTFLSKLTMPFFQATSRMLPSSREVQSAYPSAGPYAFTKHVPNSLTNLRRNRYYRGSRPGHLAGVDVRWNMGEYACLQDPLPTFCNLDEFNTEFLVSETEVAAIARKYGVNKTRFWSKPQACVGWLLFNNTRGVFRQNPSLRRAVNWALDRTDQIALSRRYRGSPWTHMLPPGFPGAIGTKRLQPYSARSNIARAKKSAKGHFRNGKVVIALGSGRTAQPSADLVRRDLIRMGFRPEDVTKKVWPTSIGVPPPPDWDIIPTGSWCADYPDPYDFFVSFLATQGPRFEPVLTLDSKAYLRKIVAAARLVGDRRLAAFGKLDLDISRNLAPVVPMRTFNNLYLFSNRVDPRSLAWNSVYGDWSIPELALK